MITSHRVSQTPDRANGRRISRRVVIALLAGLTALVVAVFAVVLVNRSAPSATQATGAQLPKDFPASVPVTSGQIALSKKVGPAWQVTVKVGDEKAQDLALANLKKQGFQVIAQSHNKVARSIYTLANTEYSIRLSYVSVDNHPAVNYSVAPRQNGSAHKKSHPTTPGKSTKSAPAKSGAAAAPTAKSTSS